MTEEAAEYQPSREFEPTRFLSKVNGRDYLEVKWRVYWARTMRPDISITTELVHYGPQFAVFRATVAWDSATGIVSCSDWGSESSDDFADFLEKASTKAIGRALALAGFGTQFCDDHESGSSALGTPAALPNNVRPMQGGRAQATPRQLGYLYQLAKELMLTEADLDDRARQEFGAVVADLGRREVSTLIEQIAADRQPTTR